MTAPEWDWVCTGTWGTSLGRGDRMECRVQEKRIGWDWEVRDTHQEDELVASGSAAYTLEEAMEEAEDAAREELKRVGAI